MGTVRPIHNFKSIRKMWIFLLNPRQNYLRSFQKLLSKTLMSAELRACEDSPNSDPDLGILLNLKGPGYAEFGSRNIFSWQKKKLDTFTVWKNKNSVHFSLHLSTGLQSFRFLQA
jgi:hypothetical protein